MLMTRMELYLPFIILNYRLSIVMLSNMDRRYGVTARPIDHAPYITTYQYYDADKIIHKTDVIPDLASNLTITNRIY